jgi:hypothetical protein
LLEKVAFGAIRVINAIAIGSIFIGKELLNSTKKKESEKQNVLGD